MSNIATVTHLRPSQRPVERRVAEVEDGYTRLANALYEELIGADLTKNQSKVAHAICRKTYGYGKKMDRISDSQLAQITRLPRQKVNKAKNELIAMKVILREGQQIGPNKNIEEWQIEGCHYSGDNVTALVTKSVTNAVTALSPKQGHTKETITKEKEIIKTLCPKVFGRSVKNHLTVTKKPTRHSRKYSGVQACGRPGRKTQLRHSEHSSGNGVKLPGVRQASLPRCWQKTSHAGMVSSSDSTGCYHRAT